MRNVSFCFLNLLFVTASARRALACPNCETAEVVRASVYDASFWPNLALVLLPLVFLAALCRRLYRIGS